MMRDKIRLDAPAAQKELAFLRALKLGEIRREPLLPALTVGMEWVCVAIQEHPTEFWKFDGKFFGQWVFTAKIAVDAGMLTLEIDEVQK